MRLRNSSLSSYRKDDNGIEQKVATGLDWNDDVTGINQIPFQSTESLFDNNSSSDNMNNNKKISTVNNEKQNDSSDEDLPDLVDDSEDDVPNLINDQNVVNEDNHQHDNNNNNMNVIENENRNDIAIDNNIVDFDDFGENVEPQEVGVEIRLALFDLLGNIYYIFLFFYV